MTSKVEELRMDVISHSTLISPHELVDSLISAVDAEALARGKAEGAEQEREKIRRMQLCGRRVRVSQFPDDERRNLRIETDVDGVAYTLIPVSVLAPTKK